MKFIGGHPALDFVNTVSGWSEGTPLEDKLEDFSDLVRWATAVRLLSPDQANGLARLGRNHPRQSFYALARARSLRLALYRILNCLLETENPKPADLELLQKELRIARQHQALEAAGRALVWSWGKRTELDSVLWRISQSAADLLTSNEIVRLRRCAGETCRWMFLDTSRNHSRQWCDMKDCGNLAKIRRFRARQAQLPGTR